MAFIRRLSPPNLPVSPPVYSNMWQEQFSNVLRLFFNQLVTFVNAPSPYGSFYDTSTQTNPVASATNIAKLNTKAEASRVTVSDGSTAAKIYVAESGVYNIQFSAQIQKGGGPAADVFFWLLVNGTALADSAGYATLSPNTKSITAWNYITSLNGGDYVQLAWASSDTGVTLPTIAAAGSIPASPSLIFTVNWVSSLSI